MTKFKNTILLTALLSISTAASSNEIQREFNYIDLDRNQNISYDEFYVIMMQHEMEAMEKEFYDADRNDDKKLDINEAQVFEVTYDEYYQADVNNSGQIDLSEFIEAYIYETFHQSDLNKDQNLDYKEYAFAVEND